jgi:NADH dehydrogenase (ubiquinone) Fe-S protein 1
MSGNVVDLCPVGALTSKPYAFQSRPWELKKTESVDVLDGVGSNIRIDSRGVQVMRIQPRVNDSLNEEWINDKTRYAYDGLRFQRLTTPLVKRGDRFEPAGWADALEAVHYGLQKSGATGDEIVGVAGALADAESMVALKDFLNRLGSENLTVDTPAGAKPPVHGTDFRANYLFNTTIAGLDEADAVLLVGTDPRHEAAIINTRLRRTYLKTPVEFGLVGPKVDLTYEYEHLGEGAADVVSFLGASGSSKPAGSPSAFAKAFAGAKKPLIILGSGVAEQANGKAVYEAVARFVDAHKDRFLTPEWNGFSVLQRVRPPPGLRCLDPPSGWAATAR